MNTGPEKNIEAVRRYFDGCSSGDIDVLRSTLADDVVHYFLPGRFPPIRGAEHLAKYWRKFKSALDPVWSIDQIIAQDNAVVSEWSLIWTNSATQARHMVRGTEWYVMRDDKIAEVRAYFMFDENGNSELPEFPYHQRGYLDLRG
jgi:ketosteroid isomerase-like protein